MKFRTFVAGTTILAASMAPALADPESCHNVRFSDLGWTDLALTNATAAVLLESLGYQSEQTFLGLNVTYEMLKGNEIDVFLGNWLPVQEGQFKSYFDDGDVEVLATNLTGAKFTLAVPTYVAEKGVVSFGDLAEYADKFNHSIYGIEAGGNQPLLDMVAADRHGLGDWEIVESSESAMLSQVSRVVRSNGWIVFLAWAPHPMNISYDLTYLSGGDKEYGPDYGGGSVRTITRKGYKNECPNIAQLLENLVFDLEYENIGMNMITSDGADPIDAASEMIRQRPELLKKWLHGVTTSEGENGYEAARASLLDG